MKTNEKFLSFYYRNMKEIPDIHLDLKKTALLIVDMQKHFIAKDGYDALQCKEAGVSYRITCNNGNQRTLINP